MMHTLSGVMLILFIIAGSSAFVSAQERTKASSSSGPQGRAANAVTRNEASDTAARTNADETFVLNIAERRITRRDFSASTSVEVGDESARGLNLRVGVAVAAGEIDVLLRNVRGQVRFRATLDRVLQRINAHRATSPSP